MIKALGKYLCHPRGLLLWVAKYLRLSYDLLAKIGSYAKSQINIWQEEWNFSDWLSRTITRSLSEHTGELDTNANGSVVETLGGKITTVGPCRPCEVVLFLI